MKMKGGMKADELQELLRKLYPRFPSKVTGVIVPTVPRPLIAQATALEKYHQAFKKNESLHHSHLKWFGLHWCIGAAFEESFAGYKYEARIAYPDRLTLALSEEGNVEIVGQGIVLPAGQPTSAFGCLIKVADVFGENGIVECGDTDPSSLVLPLAARVANRVLWLPHQHKDLRSNWPESSTQCEAMLVERQKGICKPAKRSNLYTVRTIYHEGNLLSVFGDRDWSIHHDLSSGAISQKYCPKVICE